jgi:primosomal protein N' (replication factor Y)
MKNMKIVTVIPLKKGIWKENLTYFTSKDIPNGSIVVIPLRNKKILGLVVSGEDVTSSKSNIKDMSFNLKKISEVKEVSIFSKEYLDAIIASSKYFAESKNNAITALIPAPLRENYDKIAKSINKKNKEAELLLKSSASQSIKSEKLLFQAPFEERISTYKTLIRVAFAEKKSIFIVLPTTYDIKIFEESLSRGIEQFIFSLHGGLSAPKLIQKFEQIMSLDHPILILGTAPFLSIPRNDIKTIIVEHESSSIYKMIAKPHFDLRFFTELFAAKINAKFILSDTLLRFETIERKEEDNLIPLHPMQFRINFKKSIEIINPNPNTETTQNKKQFRIFSDKTIKELKDAIANKKNVFIFALRKGLATITVCKDCNETVSCKKCGAPLVLYSSHKNKKRIFICNRCEKDVDGDTVCANCGGWNLMPLGIGNDTVYEEIEKIFDKKIKIFKLDKESAKTEKGAEKIIKEFEEQSGSILIGTEMAFFYLKEKTPLSIIASFDSLWSIPSFKMSEKIIQIILSIISHTSEKIIIQTKNENDGSLLAIKSGNLLHFVREELEDRRKLNYPPFKRFIKITYIGDKTETTKARTVLAEVFKEYNPEIFSAFIAKQKPARNATHSVAGGEKYMTNALIRLEPKKWSLPEISTNSHIDENLYAKLLSLPPSFQVLVDPEDLL